VAKGAGNGLAQIQTHYWNRNEAITEEIADEYFRIVPVGMAENALIIKKAAWVIVENDKTSAFRITLNFKEVQSLTP
jgi:hypothetical protein